MIGAERKTMEDIQIAIMKDNADRHEKVMEKIMNLTLIINKYNGIKEKVDGIDDTLNEHLTIHETLDKFRAGSFTKMVMVVTILVAISSVVIAVIK